MRRLVSIVSGVLLLLAAAAVLFAVDTGGPRLPWTLLGIVLALGGIVALSIPALARRARTHVHR